MNRESATTVKVCLIIKLLEYLCVKHTDNQVIRFRGDVVFSLLEDRDLQSDDFIKGKARMYIIEGDELDAFLAKNSKS